MKLAALFLPSLLCAASASAQYFSSGWSPGQPVSEESAPSSTAPAYTFDPAPKSTPVSGQIPDPNLGFFDRVLTSGPIASLFGRLGMNISDAVERGSTLSWDPRIPLITDENYDEVIVNETLSEQEEKDRVWFLIVSVTASQNNAISKIVDQSFDDAYNQTVIAGDLPNVRWGRIDYMSVTYLTTKWSIWTGPYFIVLTDRGQTLRFYKADRIRISSDLIRELLTEEIWRNTEPWTSNFAPGRKREFILHYYALVLQKVYVVINRVPRIFLMVASGAVASFVMRFLHRNPNPDPTPELRATEEQMPKVSAKAESETSTAVGSTGATSTVTSSPSKSKGKQRKVGKR